MYREQFGTDFVYDSRGNRKSATYTSGIASSATYDAYNNVLTSTTPGRTVATNEDWGDTEEEKRKHLLRRSTSPLGRVSAYQ